MAKTKKVRTAHKKPQLPKDHRKQQADPLEEQCSGKIDCTSTISIWVHELQNISSWKRPTGIIKVALHRTIPRVSPWVVTEQQKKIKDAFKNKKKKIMKWWNYFSLTNGSKTSKQLSTSSYCLNINDVKEQISFFSEKATQKSSDKKARNCHWE